MTKPLASLSANFMSPTHTRCLPRACPEDPGSSMFCRLSRRRDLAKSPPSPRAVKWVLGTLGLRQGQASPRMTPEYYWAEASRAKVKVDEVIE